MPTSQNGYSANDRSVTTSYVVTAAGRTMNLRKGSPGELLAHMVRWFDENIRDIDVGILDDWSYAERPIRGSTTELSNHSSGTAADVDATQWPLGSEPSAYLTANEIARVRAQLKIYEGCIRWGGDYTGRKDPMHFEIDRDEATCDRVWQKIRSAKTGGFLMGLTDAQQFTLAQDAANARYAILNLVKPSTDQIPGLLAAIGKLSEAVAAGDNDLTAAELKQAVVEALQENAAKVNMDVAPGLNTGS